MKKVDWNIVFNDGALEQCGSEVSTLQEFAAKISKKIKQDVTVDGLFAAHRRHKRRLRLKSSLTDYMPTQSKADKSKKQPRKRPEDIKFALSQSARKEVRQATKFIVTSAMNNCQLNEDLWASIQSWAKFNKAKIVVVPVRYRNPTNPGECVIAQEDAWWPEEVWPYATDELVKLHEKLWVMGHVRVQATAIHPLSGLEALSKGASAIFGHSQLAMTTVPVSNAKYPKVLYTTGSVSVPKYSDSRAGINGEFHHNMGAVVVELKGPVFFIRSVSMDKDGGFYDLEHYYGPQGATKAENHVEALIAGDIHVQFLDKAVKEATFTGKDSISKRLRPKRTIVHDVLDSYSISHHNKRDPVIQYSKHLHGHQLVETELRNTLSFLEEITPDWGETLVVPSNHHEHLCRWLKEVSAPAEEPWNAKVWLELWQDLISTLEYKDRGVVHGDPFALWCSKRTKKAIRFLEQDQSYKILDIEVNTHGNHGINGSRGSLNQFTKLGVKTVSGHRHWPAINHGAWSVGTSTGLRLEYTRGPSSWANAHCLIYKNGKRQIIFVINGQYKG